MYLIEYPILLFGMIHYIAELTRRNVNNEMKRMIMGHYVTDSFVPAEIRVFPEMNANEP